MAISRKIGGSSAMVGVDPIYQSELDVTVEIDAEPLAGLPVTVTIDSHNFADTIGADGTLSLAIGMLAPGSYDVNINDGATNYLFTDAIVILAPALRWSDGAGGTLLARRSFG